MTISIQLTALEWMFILGWIDGKETPNNLPPVIIRLRSIIQDMAR